MTVGDKTPETAGECWDSVYNFDLNFEFVLITSCKTSDLRNVETRMRDLFPLDVFTEVIKQ